MSVTDEQRKRAYDESRERFCCDMLQIEKDRQERVRIAYEEGFALGRLFGKIKVHQFASSLPPTPKQDLEKRSLDELQRIADELRRRVIAAS